MTGMSIKNQQNNWLCLGGLISRPLPLLIGFSFVEAWSQTLFSHRFSLQLPLSPMSVTVMHMVGSICAGLFALVIVLLASRLAPLCRHREALWLCGFGGTLGTIGLLLVAQGALDSVWGIYSNILVTICSVWLSMFWFEMFASEGVRGAAICFLISAIFGGILGCFIQLVPAILASVLVTVMPLLAAFSLRPRGKTQLTTYRSDCRPRIGQLLKSTPLALLVVVGLVWFSSGSLLTLDLTSSTPQGDTASIVIESLARMVMMSVAIVVAVFSSRRNAALVFYAAIPCMLAALLLLALNIGMPTVIPLSIVRIATEIIRFLVIFLLIGTSLKNETLVLFSFSLLFCLQFFGTAAGQALSIVFGDDWMLASLLLIAVLVVLAMFVFIARKYLEIGMALKGQHHTEGVLESIVREYALTPKEGEVLKYWIGGHNSSFIEDRLHVSKHTVKTHIKHIYDKTDAHSKEELIRLFESYQQIAEDR